MRLLDAIVLLLKIGLVRLEASYASKPSATDAELFGSAHSIPFAPLFADIVGVAPRVPSVLKAVCPDGLTVNELPGGTVPETNAETLNTNPGFFARST